jgi:hypothetical protein
MQISYLNGKENNTCLQRCQEYRLDLDLQSPLQQNRRNHYRNTQDLSKTDRYYRERYVK